MQKAVKRPNPIPNETSGNLSTDSNNALTMDPKETVSEQTNWIVLIYISRYILEYNKCLSRKGYIHNKYYLQEIIMAAPIWGVSSHTENSGQDFAKVTSEFGFLNFG